MSQTQFSQPLIFQGQFSQAQFSQQQFSQERTFNANFPWFMEIFLGKKLFFLSTKYFHLQTLHNLVSISVLIGLILRSHPITNNINMVFKAIHLLWEKACGNCTNNNLLFENTFKVKIIQLQLALVGAPQEESEKGFKKEENGYQWDEALVYAWGRLQKDPIFGTNKTDTTYYQLSRQEFLQ